VVAACYLLGGFHPADGQTRRNPPYHQSVEGPGVGDGLELDVAVEAFGSRPLDAGPYTSVAADALVRKVVREAGRVINVHALIAVGVNAKGYREILGIDVSTAEDGAGWRSGGR
jgi:putative transposase